MNYYTDVYRHRPYLDGFDFNRLDHSSYIIDLGALKRNIEILDSVQQRTGAKILLALKGFANYSTFPMINKYLKGCCASSPHEARLAREEFGGEVHSFAPAYSQKDMDEQLQLSDHIVFNSFAQFKCYKDQVISTTRDIEIGLRVNPLHSETEVDLYNPCAPGSRLGILPELFEGEDLSGVDGLHFHTLCQKGAAPLARTAAAFEDHFGKYLHQLKWINFGGGHHITQPDYDLDLLCETISHFKKKYDLDVYLEPGEAVGINTGSLVCEVVEIVEHEQKIAILDISATCHMPDVLEMPYRPEVRGAEEAGKKRFTYKLGGLSCLAGDVIGDYSFDQELAIGDKVVFDDMAHYTMVKTSFFNGISHPSIVLYNPADDSLKTVREFGYEHYKSKL
ncbi:MAG: carboxynorspermidine decarboxylase [Lentisphaeraceae bacterium]|nr:carboxynorspermidine decarboxylase [Lentisphaeraceae bacterium]